MSKVRPLILVSNDDGITAPGIRALVEAVQPLGDVVIVAPDSPQSGMGHAVTISKPLRLDQIRTDIYGELQAWQCSGTPADCVKLAVSKVLHRKPDLLVSGINHGSNSSINVIYSGTMSAAVEGAIESIPSVGFSLLDYSYDADFSYAKKVANTVAKNILTNGLPKGTLLNVNIPKLKEAESKGIKVCRQALAKWEEEFDERKDPNGRTYYWLTGKFVNYDKGEDTDEWALQNGYVSLVPVHFDLTAHESIAFINQWNLND
ncbi:MAG: 5'/3'-nucleotidase SurE [Bacteroidia bacterium]|nr:5'/3'-nucleotidase SurE [Bacteroidia bacterium]MBP7259992.1 5'/3'-nucleotidase SurE [Bacteroidia bacterium]MBP9179699.1 5'/3'-nucleotidase SurE [Bacteroidia bacterium]MBP9723902.1 5'/3'-nucleotidase SurE [Bacteroidia bacterium]